MRIAHERKHEIKIKRTDIWREGEWLDLWSVVHLLSGLSIGFGLSFLHFGILASIALVFVSLVSYEMWEALVQIEETLPNRCMDVVVGMCGFLISFFSIVPRLSTNSHIFTFGVVLSANIVLSILGWHASHKAAELQKRMRERYFLERIRLLERRAKKRNKSKLRQNKLQ